MNLKSLSLICLSLILCLSCNKSQVTYGTVTDVDGNQYKTVKIAGQEWMCENLRTEHYRNGNTIPAFVKPEDRNSIGCVGWGTYKLTPEDLEEINNDCEDPTLVLYHYKRKFFNKLVEESPKLRYYNFAAVCDLRGICPKGWHVPQKEEWESYILQVQKEFDTQNSTNVKEPLWIIKPNGLGRLDLETSDIIGRDALYWTSSNAEGNDVGMKWVEEYTNTGVFMKWLSTDAGAWFAMLTDDSTHLNLSLKEGTTFKDAMLSVRCVKDRP